MSFLYPACLGILSLGFLIAERLFPLRAQKQLRKRFVWDLVYLIFNGHFLGVILAGIASQRLLPHLDRWLGQHGMISPIYRNAASHWPVWLQVIVALLAVDFLQWCVHNLLHRVGFLWQFHQIHHSVADGEMDWIVSFRFQWAEVVVYKSLLYLPLAFFGFGPAAMMFHAIFGTLVGHLNHANLDVGHGAWRYVLNSPRMHIWHHNYAAESKTTVNFGIIFSLWDWLFRTAYLPAQPPMRIGFRGEELLPPDFFGQVLWPLPRLLPRTRLAGVLAGAAGAALLALGFWLTR